MEKKRIIVCVTAQQSSKKLVEAGKTLAEKYDAVLETVSVLPPNTEDSRIDTAAIDEIHRMTEEFGGEMMIIFNDEPVYALIAHIGKKKPLTVVTGYPGERSNNFIDSLRMILPSQEIAMVNGEQIYTILPSPEGKLRVIAFE